MLEKDWIKATEANGWRVSSVSSIAVDVRCAVPGCPSAMTLPHENLGPVPERCAEPHPQGYSAPAFALYEDLIDALCRRRRSLGLAQEDVASAAGLTEGHINKLEAFARIGTFPTIQLWAETLGLALSLAPAPLPDATTRTIQARRASPYAPHRVTNSKRPA